MKILIAEDEETIAKGIAAILQMREEYRCRIKFAENGKEALELAEMFRPDLVITDVRMFQMTGLELVEQLKERGLCTKVIIISGYSNFEYAQKALRMNVIDYLLKPIDKQQLLYLVDQIWAELPSNYGIARSRVPSGFSFFELNLDQAEYPASLKKAITFLRKNYMNDISLQSLSEELMLHPNYISALINKHIQVNFNYLLDYVRLQKACELLLQPEMTIAEISYIAGYNNERRLYHAFQKRLRCTPGDFRKSNAVILP